MGSTGSSGGGEKIVVSGSNPASTKCLPIEDTRVSFITCPLPPISTDYWGLTLHLCLQQATTVLCQDSGGCGI